MPQLTEQEEPAMTHQPLHRVLVEEEEHRTHHRSRHWTTAQDREVLQPHELPMPHPPWLPLLLPQDPFAGVRPGKPAAQGAYL